MRTISLTLALLILLAQTAHAETALELETQAIAALKLWQTQPDAIISATIYFGKAGDAYDAAADAAKTAEMNTFLFWCKRKISLAQMNALLKAGDGAASAIRRMKEFEKTVAWPAEGPAYLERAETFAKEHAGDHLLIAIRFFEVAERFKGSDTGTQAQERQLKELALATPADGAKMPPPQKVPLPSAAQWKAAEKNIRELYKEDFAKNTAAEKLALARKLAAQASDTKDDIPGHYQLLALAATLAAEAADLEQIFAAYDSLASDFEGDLAPHQKAALTLAASSTKDPLLTKAALAYRVLLERPADSPALLTVGKYECFCKSDYARGLPRLAKTPQGVLSKIAKDELANPELPAAQLALADAWWDNGEKSADKDEKRASQERAIIWYKKALPALTGLNKTRVEIRLTAVGAIASTAPPVSTAPKAPLPISSGSPIGKPTDLIGLIDTARDKGPGDWKVRGKVLECVKEVKYSSIKVRYKPGEQYDLRAVFTRLSGDDDIGFNLICGGRRTLLSLCGWHNTLAGFHGINGKDVDSDSNPTRTPNSLDNGKEYKMDVQVRKYSVRILLNGKELLKYNFEGSEFTGVAGKPPSKSEPTFGIYCSSSTARFTVLEVTELPPAPADAKPDIKAPVIPEDK